jgi:Tfp pilus assembly protein FimT
MKTEVRGASLLEGLVAVAVTALLATLAPAGLSAWAAGQRLQAMTAQLETELQHARALAVARNQLVRLGLPEAGGGRCVVLYSGPAGACGCADNLAPVCLPDGQMLRAIEIPPGLSVRPTGVARHFAFSGVHGTVSPTATLEVRHQDGRALRLVVNLMGRIRACAVGAAWAGHPAC